MSENDKTHTKSNGNGPDKTGEPKRFGDNGEALVTETAAETAEAKAEAEKYKNEFLYLRAEFENFKKQAIKERSDLRKYGCERLVADLLGVLDIFDTALTTEVTPDTLSSFRKGIEMTAAEFKSVLQRHGISEITLQNHAFDPAMFEALGSEETNEVPAGTITKVFKKAYKLHDRVVRPGQVIVARPKAE